MTATAMIKRSDLKRLMEVAEKGYQAEVEMPDGRIVRIGPRDIDNDSGAKIDKGRDIQI